MHDWVLTREGNETEIVKSMISLKWMALTTKTVVAIDFYRLIDTIDVNKKSDYRQLSIYRVVIRYRFLSIVLAGPLGRKRRFIFFASKGQEM